MNAGNPTREHNFPSGSIDNLLIESLDHTSPITTGAWRAPITNFLAYAEQAFLDEVSEAMGKDPVQMRLDLLQKARTKPAGPIRYDIDRMETVIKTVAEKSQWGKKPGVSQGLSVYFSHASYVGQVCDVVMNGGKPVISKITAVSDCGVVINSSGAQQQVMGGILDGMGHALYGKLTFNAGEPEQKNFNVYRHIRMKGMPEVEAHFVDNGKDPTGLGEPALPPAGGAVANAIYKATGKRMYKQPFIEQEPLKESE
jgi:isoquinoline 1-oxidoreductase beta subunit